MAMASILFVVGGFAGYHYGYVREHAFFKAHQCHGVTDGYICADGAVYK
jgi:hypothetical protein